MKTLICDLNVYENGHHISFVRSLVNSSNSNSNTIFLFNEEAGVIQSSLKSDYRVHFVKESILLGYKKRGLLRSKFLEYFYIKRFAQQNTIDRIFFLDIDQYQIPIGLSSSKCLLTGIYFRPYHMVRIKSTSISQSLKNLVYKYKKYFIFKIFRLNKKVEQVYLLNDLSASIKFPNLFKHLPDPIFINNQSQKASIRQVHSIHKDTHIYLIFGAISSRKNIDTIINAFNKALITQNAVLLIVGKVRSDYSKSLNQLLNKFETSNSNRNKRIVVVDKFVDDDMMDSYFEESDTILLCYKKFYGSSGLLGRASLFSKPCIVPNKGLLSRLCEQYSIGFTVDSECVNDIANALCLAEKKEICSSGHDRFIGDHSEEAFLSTILNA